MEILVATLIAMSNQEVLERAGWDAPTKHFTPARTIRHIVTAPLRALKWVVVHRTTGEVVEVHIDRKAEEYKLLGRFTGLVGDMYLNGPVDDDVFFQRTEALYRIMNEWHQVRRDKWNTDHQ